MDLRQLRAFEAVARCGGFSKASREMGLTQPTLSTHIRNLEDSLGVRLFDRASRSVTLTPAGTLLAGYARRILDLAEETVQAVEAFTGRVSGSIHVDASTVPGEYLLPRWLMAFHRRYPEVLVTLSVSDSSLVFERVADAEVALGVAGSAPEHPSLESQLLCEDEIILVAAPDLLQGRDRGPMPVARLADLPLIRRESGSGTQSSVEKALTEHGMDPESLRWSATLGSTRAVVEGAMAGLGGAFLSRYAVARELGDGALEQVHVDGFTVQRGFYVITNSRKTLSPAAGRFLDELLENGSELTASHERS